MPSPTTAFFFRQPNFRQLSFRRLGASLCLSGALAAALAVLVFFSLFAPQFLSLAGAGVWLESASTFGIMAVAVALLMIGGEFDLSAGVMTGFSALIVGILTPH